MREVYTAHVKMGMYLVEFMILSLERLFKELVLSQVQHKRIGRHKKDYQEKEMKLSVVNFWILFVIVAPSITVEGMLQKVKSVDVYYIYDM